MPSFINQPHAHTEPGVYDLLPTFPLPEGQIQTGWAALARQIEKAFQAGARLLAIDGYGCVLWDDFQSKLGAALGELNIPLMWRAAADSMLPETRIDALVDPYLGGDDPIFGRLCDFDLAAFFDSEGLPLPPDEDHLTIMYGVGAALIGAPDYIIYVDVPKDEIQRRMMAGTVSNLGASGPATYKRLYFVDWPVLNRHKARLLPGLDCFVDGQNPREPTLIAGDNLRAGLALMSRSSLRARPWFAPGPWGGQYMKENFPGLPGDVPNYAWSFELITPENGLVFESGAARLECSFDLLMFGHYQDVLGSAAERFGYDFPIRFDYLDTISGGNLSIQCHPRPEYIRENFGEPFTQDESYYITTCTPGAGVYLGFRDDIDAGDFRAAVEHSAREGVTIEAEDFINRVDAHPHDLFLIPAGTIHGSGAGNLVLEISATPYIYTFKIYDWIRRDLNGNLRPLNIDRAWDNLYFERGETYAREKLCPAPVTLDEGDGWREVFVGTHEALFYAVHRYELTCRLEASTGGRCLILNVVEGTAVLVETENGYHARYNFAETFIIPAAAGRFTLTPVGESICKVVFAFVKD